MHRPVSIQNQLMFILFSLLILSACSNGSKQNPREIDSDLVEKTNTVIPEPEKEIVVESYPVTWKKPNRKSVNAKEESYTGTWVGEVSKICVKTGGQAFMLPGGGTNLSDPDFVEDFIEAFDAGEVEKDNCVWLELYDDYTGFWASCMMVAETPTILDKVDPLTGTKKAMGLEFEWYLEDDNIRIKFEDTPKVPYVTDTVITDVKIHYWNLHVMGEKLVGDETMIVIKDEFPEYHYTLPFTNDFGFYKDYLIGKTEDYAKPMMD